MTIKRLKAPYDGYGVGSDGNIWSFKNGTKTPVKPRPDKDGSLRVNLADQGTSKNGFKEIYVHKLVARAFLGKGGGQAILHKDGNNQNNKSSNLQYGSLSLNAKQREEHKRQRGDSEDDESIDVTDLLENPEYETLADALWRYDATVKATWHITPEGYLQADRIVVAQSKEYEYADPSFPNGKRVEFVTVDALEALALSLVGKPVTDEHPQAGKVDASTWRILAMGVVQRCWVEFPSDDNDLEFPSCIASAIVSDRGLVEKVTKDNITEVSPGYDATLARVPEGSTQFGGAHFLQTSRAGNHLAVTKAGRGGSASAIRLDSAGHAIYNEDGMTPEEMKKKLDAAEEATKAFQLKADALQAKVDAFEALEKDKKDKQDAADKADAEDKETRMDKADFVALYNERKNVEDIAARLGVTVNAADATDAIKASIVKAKMPTFARVDSVSVNAAFEVVSGTLPAANSPDALGDAARRNDGLKPPAPAADDLFAAYAKKGN
jgi:hypothetical protein